ncbi:MAG: VCBS repeat-containing protein [Oscillospiraceae bacterium]|jgi:hypothetical protein|nr:VCBS repeat-containing protein [Oscillospiraceae bacterium]
MRSARAKKCIAAICLLIALTMSGCLNARMEELFTLPRPSEEYLKLQDAIEDVLDTGVVYSAPAGGNNRQSVQLWDFDGDGVSEAVAFFSGPGDNPLKLYVLKKNADEVYEPALILEGEGTGFASVDYSDLDGDGWLDIIVSRRISSELRMLRVYSVRDFQPSPLATADYSEYSVADLVGAGRSQLYIIRYDAAEMTGSVEMMTFAADGEFSSVTAPLSAGVESILRIRRGTLTQGRAALFVDEGFRSGGLITDIFTAADGALKNITRGGESGASLATVRDQSIYTRDIDSDGVTEVPVTRELEGAGETVFRLVDWMSFDAEGRPHLKMTTYHNRTDGWYFILPEAWAETVTVRRDDHVSGERAVIFSVPAKNDGPPVDVLVIYSITGENREDRSVLEGRTVLRTEDEVIYACKILAGAVKIKDELEMSYVRAGFKLIYSEWSTGLT